MRKLFGFFNLNLTPSFEAEGGSAGGSGSGGNAAGANDGNAGAGGEGSNGGSGAGNGQGNPPKSYSQEDVDKMVNERLGREQKKFQKQLDDLKKQLTAGGDGQGNANAGGQSGEGGNQISEEALKAQATLAAANQRLVQATAVAEAVKLGVDPKYTSDVVRLADLSKIEVKDDGTMDAGAISKQLDEVLKRVPVFKSNQNNVGGFRVGGEGQQPPAGNGWNSTQQQNQQVKRWNRTNH